MSVSKSTAKVIIISFLFIFFFIGCKGNENTEKNKNEQRKDNNVVSASIDNKTAAQNESSSQVIPPVVIDYPHDIESIKKKYSEIALFEPNIENELNAIIQDMNSIVLPEYNKPDMSEDDKTYNKMLSGAQKIIDDYFKDSDSVVLRGRYTVNKSDVVKYLDNISKGLPAGGYTWGNQPILSPDTILSDLGVQHKEISELYYFNNNRKAVEEALRQYNLIIQKIYGTVSENIKSNLTQDIQISRYIWLLESIMQKDVSYHEDRVKIHVIPGKESDIELKTIINSIIKEIEPEWQYPEGAKNYLESVGGGYQIINDSLKKDLNTQEVSQLKDVCLKIKEARIIYEQRNDYKNKMKEVYDNVSLILEGFNSEIQNENASSDIFVNTVRNINNEIGKIDDILGIANKVFYYEFTNRYGFGENFIENFNNKVNSGIDRKPAETLIEICNMLKDNNAAKHKAANELYELKKAKEHEEYLKSPEYASSKAAYLKGYKTGIETRKKHLGTPMLIIYEDEAGRMGRELAEKEGLKGDEYEMFSQGYNYGILGLPSEM